jgi:hypothetical protein
MDWALIESWKERGVPLHVALRGIEHSFDSHDAKNAKRTVKTLLYCQEEVEAQYAEWLESRVGSDDGRTAESENDKTPFSKRTVLQHLDRSLEDLGKLAADCGPEEDEMSETFGRAVSLLSEIRNDYESASHADSRKLEESLTGLERLLDDSMRRTMPDNQITALQTDIEAQLKPYKRHMDKDAFAQTRDNLLKKRIREHFGVPRLSLFFLQS